MESSPVAITVELTWTLADGFCVVYQHAARPAGRFGYCARTIPAVEFLDPAEWGESVAADLWERPPPHDELIFDDHGIGWHGQVGSTPPPMPA